MSRPRVAFFDFTSCEGCQLSKLNLEDDLLSILGLVELVNFREAISDRRDDYEIAFTAASPPQNTTPVTCIGRVERGSGVVLLDTQGRDVPVSRAGYRHF